jgi:hypothetical protein
MRASSFLLASLAPLLAACFDYHTAEECLDIGTCAPPDADAGVIVMQEGPPPCSGQCASPADADWYGPFLVTLTNPGQQPPTCPDNTRSSYLGVAPPRAPKCGACACQPSTGLCALPAMATASAGTCAMPGSGGISLDPPVGWDGSCATPLAITGGVQSVTVAPLVVTHESCTPVATTPTETPPQQVVLACNVTSGTCAAPGDACLPTAPGGMYCITHAGGASDAQTKQCPSGSLYLQRYVFADDFTEPACSPCTCGSPGGSACGTSLVSFYADGACSDEIASVTAQSSASMCVDIPVTSPLGSMTASPPGYTPGTCTPSGSTATGAAIANTPTTFCCLAPPKIQ